MFQLQRKKGQIPVMATANEKNLLDKNAAYASQFTQGELQLPPANKLAVGSYPKLGSRLKILG